MLVMIPLVYGTKNIEWTEERILYARIAFGVVQAAIVLVLLLVNSKIKKAAAHNKINVPKAAPSPFSQRYASFSNEKALPVPYRNFGTCLAPAFRSTSSP